MEGQDKQREKLEHWKEKFTRSKNDYEQELKEILDNELAYEGTREIKNTTTGEKAKKQDKIMRKVCFELVEAQVDSNIPLPKVTSRKANKNNLAKKIEDILKNEVDRLDTEELNDTQERITPITGGAILYLEWDNSIKTSSSVGDLSIKVLDPKQVIPQSGVYTLKEMDYIFLLFKQTKQKIKEKYGIDVGDEDGSELEEKDNNEELRTHVFTFYRNDDGGIGLFSWVGDVVIQDYKNYFERKEEICTKCGKPRQNNLEKCSECGSKSFKLVKKENEIISIEKMVPNQQIDPISGQVIVGYQKTIEKVKVPYYVLDQFPIIIRKNVSKINKFLGSSDVTYIKDLQNDMAIYSSKIKEKTLKGGSVLTKPKNTKIEATDEELKIIEVENPADVSLISVKNLQVNSTEDIQMLENEYQYSRQTIGITDSFQGRQDPTATSGKAKEFAAAQTAGRLNSKKIMKDFAFSKLYQLMFKFLLAFADEEREYVTQDDDGNEIYTTFSKKDFLEQDIEGNYYYNDEFIFATDISATLSQNREAMWQETRLNFTSGAYGPTTDFNTLIIFWSIMDKLHYPGAKIALNQLNNRLKEQQQMLQYQNQMNENGGDVIV